MRIINEETRLQKIRAEVNHWFAEQKNHGFDAFYAFYKRGDFVIRRGNPPGYEVLSPQRLPLNMTKEQVFVMLERQTRSVEILEVKA